jgi:heme/copper-type cytochrome/quinol oxidase subunit 1
MSVNAPKQTTWWIAVIVGAVGIIVNFVAVPVLSGIAFWLVVFGFVLLALATVLKGL